MENLIEQIENGIVDRKEIKERAEKEAEEKKGLIKRFLSDGGSIGGKGKYCAQLEGYVWKIIKENFCTFYHYGEDLFMEGLLAILSKEDQYDGKKGKPTTFFKPYIIHGMYTWINSNVFFSTSHYACWEKKVNDYLRRTGKDLASVSMQEIIGGTGIKRKTLEQILARKQMCQARKVKSGKAVSALRYYNSPEKILVAAERKQWLEEIMCRTLTGLELQIVKDYCGWDDGDCKTISQIRQKTGLSEREVRRMLNLAEEKLGDALKKQKTTQQYAY